ncbi:NrsF family protein [Massilia sp. TSP1-1-2]|uniref:NrsF family protein n=1 Tax=Massilia sp. TSP1-1-2 TaxID=2804649 RepID=UPI003CF29281
MKTDELIDMLATGPDVALARATAGRNVLLVLGALLLSGLLMGVTLGLRPHLGLAVALPAFWLKFVFSVALAGAGWLAARRLSAPGSRLGQLPLVVGAPIVLVWLVAAAVLAQSAPELRGALFWGSTWRYCPVLIALMSLPVFAATLCIMRQLAPTRLRLAGAAAGLASGGAAAALYCLHCPEMSAAFVGFWYLLGILVPTAIGALIGPRVLAW